MKKHIIIVFVLFIVIKNYSQTMVSGTIKSNNEVLVGANILAKPLTKGAKFSYAVTGNYKLQLTKNATYKFTISFVGCITLKENILLDTANFTKNFNLQDYDPIFLASISSYLIDLRRIEYEYISPEHLKVLDYKNKGCPSVLQVMIEKTETCVDRYNKYGDCNYESNCIILLLIFLLLFILGLSSFCNCDRRKY